ncbi:unnamed protein product, partial [Musa textilis]
MQNSDMDANLQANTRPQQPKKKTGFMRVLLLMLGSHHSADPAGLEARLDLLLMAKTYRLRFSRFPLSVLLVVILTRSLRKNDRHIQRAEHIQKEIKSRFPNTACTTGSKTAQIYWPNTQTSRSKKKY